MKTTSKNDKKEINTQDFSLQGKLKK